MSRNSDALAAKHKRSRLRESHDPVKGHCDRRTFDRGAGLPCREDHILRQLRIVSDPMIDTCNVVKRGLPEREKARR